MGDATEKAQFLRYFLRMSLAFVVVVVVLACLYAVCAWSVINHYQQLRSVVGAKWASRFFDVNTRVMPVILSGDRDHDGICDGLELAMRTDPKNPKDQGYVLEPDGMHMFAYDAGNIGLELHAGNHRDQMLAPGERRTVRIRLVSMLGDILGRPVVSRHLRVRIHPSPSSLVGVPGGVVSRSPVEVQVERGGIVVFDLQALVEKASKGDRLYSGRPIVLPHTVPGVPGLDPLVPGKPGEVFEVQELDFGEQIDLDNAVTGEEIGQFRFRRSWRRPPITPTVEILSRPDQIIENTFLLYKWDRYRTARVSWSSGDRSLSGFLLEVAENVPNANWFALQIYSPEKNSASISHSIVSENFPYHGPLKYRIVPLSEDPKQP